ncbi:MAG: hypothetical protein OHK0039_13300 [Bacteroidia bacterium]
MKHLLSATAATCLALLLMTCDRSELPPIDQVQQWPRDTLNPVLRDTLTAEAYEVASDACVFFDEQGQLRMFYTGDEGGKTATKLASADDWNRWRKDSVVRFQPAPAGIDAFKETCFYRRTPSGRHQLYYIG